MTTPRKTKPSEQKVELREPTPGELVAIAAAKESRAQRPRRASVSVKFKPDGVMTISNPHTDPDGWTEHVTETFGTASPAFANQSLNRLANAVGVSRPEVTTGELNAALAIMGAIAPRDELEAAIGEQIIAAHVASMDFLRRARNNAGEYRDSAAAYTSMATKVSRTMVAHVEALTKLRSGGKQTHEVRYVYVNGPAVFGDGTQAVFGGVGTQGGGGFCGKAGQPHAVAGLADASGLQVWSEDPQRQAMPISSGGGAEAMPDAWRRGGIGSPEGQGEREISDRAAHAGASRGSGAGPRRAGVGQG